MLIEANQNQVVRCGDAATEALEPAGSTTDEELAGNPSSSIWTNSGAEQISACKSIPFSADWPPVGSKVGPLGSKSVPF